MSLKKTSDSTRSEYSDNNSEGFEELVNIMRRNDTRIELYAVQLEMIIRNMEPCTPEELGTPAWLKKFNAVNKIMNAVDGKPGPADRCGELLLKYGKFWVLVHDMILLDVWIQEIMPQFVEICKTRPMAELAEIESSSFCFHTAYFLMTHRRLCTNIVGSLLQDSGIIAALRPCHMINIIDHAMRCLKAFIDKKPDRDPKLLLEESKGTNHIPFQDKLYLGMYDAVCQESLSNFSCLYFLITKLDKLPPSVIRKITHPDTRLLITVVDLIQARPWCYSKPASYGLTTYGPASDNASRQHGTRKLPLNEYGNTIPCDPIESCCWLILFELLVEKANQVPAVLRNMTTECYQKLLLLQEPLRIKSFVKRMPRSLDVKGFLARISITPIPTVDESIGLIAVPLPAKYHASITSDVHKKKDAIIKIHEAMGTFETPTWEQHIYKKNLTMSAWFKDLNMYCFRCGKSDSISRCSGCHFAYYCSRRCQSKNWAKHKPNCSPIGFNDLHIMFGMPGETTEELRNKHENRTWGKVE